MTEATVIDLARETIWVVVESAFPLLIVSLIIGLVVSIFQTITSIQEQTLTFVPKFLAIMLIIVLCGNWMMNNMTGLFIDLMERIPEFIR